MIDLSLKEPIFENTYVGEVIGPRRTDADERLVRQAMFSLDDYSSWYTESFPPLKQRIVPSTWLVRDLHHLLTYHFDPARMMGLHQREEVSFHNPVPLNTKLVYTGQISNKFEKRGKGYVVYEAEARDAATGMLYVKQLCTEIMRVPKDIALGGTQPKAAEGGRRVSGQLPPGRAFESAATLPVAAGIPISPLHKVAHQDHISVFAACDRQQINIHTSRDRAAVGGYRDTLLPGLMQSCWASEMAARFFGENWLYSGKINQVYLRPVYCHQSITTYGVTTGQVKTSHGSEATAEVWTVNENNEMTSAGWISCDVGRGGERRSAEAGRALSAEVS